MLKNYHARAILVALLTLATIVFAVQPALCAEDFPLTYFQAYLGAASFDEDAMTFVEASDADPDAVSASDLSSMPYLGIAGQFALSDRPTHYGLDASLLFGWRSDDSSITAGNGQARIEIDSSLWLCDLAVGLYVQTLLADRWRLYGAVGPALIFGEYSDDTSEENLTVTPYTEDKNSSSDSIFGFGGYAKLGLEYELSPSAYMGIAVRGITTNVEFDRAVDDGGLSGVQGFITFTRAY